MVKFRIWKGQWTKKDCEAHPDDIFVYGDNERRQGCNGQAQIRPCDNAVGIRTRHRPTSFPAAYWSDAASHTNSVLINEDFNTLQLVIEQREAQNKDCTVWFAEDGCGASAAKLQKKAPKTYAYLASRLNSMLGEKIF